MTLSCPSCKSRFMIDPAVLLPNGRKVRCGFCGERWFQEPLPELAAEETVAGEAPDSADAAQEPVAESTPQAEEAFEPSDEPEMGEATAEDRAPEDLPPGPEAAGETPLAAEPEKPSDEMAADSGRVQPDAGEEESADEDELPGSGASAGLEEPWEDDSLAAVVAADLPEEASAEDEVPAAAEAPETASGQGPDEPGDADFGAETAYGAEEADESDWDSDWRGTQPLAEESLAAESLAGEDGSAEDGSEERAEAEDAEEYGEPDAESEPAKVAAEAPEITESEAAGETTTAYDPAEALFEEPSGGGLGAYGDQEEVQSWDDLEKAEESDVSAQPEEPEIAAPADRPEEKTDQAEYAEIDGAAEERAPVGPEDRGPYSDTDEDQESEESVLADLGIESAPLEGEGEATAGDAWESSLFAKKGTSRATILSPEDQGEISEAPDREEVAQDADSPAAESGAAAEQPAAEAPGAEPTVYVDADEEPADQAEGYDPGRALEEVAKPEEAAEAVEPAVVAESKPIKTMSDYLVAAVDDEEIEDKEEDWGVSELESFFRDEERQKEADGGNAAETAAPAATPEAGPAAAAAEEAQADLPEASDSARAKFRRVMAAGATAAAAQEAASESEGTEEEEAAAELAAAAQAKAAGGGSLARGWSLYFATLLALGSVFYFGRGRLVDFEPRMAELYKLIGL